MSLSYNFLSSSFSRAAVGSQEKPLAPIIDLSATLLLALVSLLPTVAMSFSDLIRIAYGVRECKNKTEARKVMLMMLLQMEKSISFVCGSIPAQFFMLASFTLACPSTLSLKLYAVYYVIFRCIKLELISVFDDDAVELMAICNLIFANFATLKIN